MFTRIIYLSKAAHALKDTELLTLANQTTEKNKRLGLTGYLYYSCGKFFHYIEGSRDVVESLMDIIREDERHRIIEELVDHGHSDRLFSGWHVRWLRQIELQALQLEHTVADYIDGKSSFSDQHYWEDRIWEMVHQIAENQRHFPVETGPIEFSNVERILNAKV